MKTEASILIHRPIAEVFAKTRDDVTVWSSTCVEDEVIESINNGGVGTTSRLVTEDRGRRMEFEGVVTEHNPPRQARVFFVGQVFDLDVNYLFESVGSGTRITQKAIIQGKGFAKVMFLLFGWAMKKSGCKAQEHELAALKDYCEASDAASRS